MNEAADSSTVQPAPLYEAAVGFLVSERSNNNAWEQVARYVDAYTRKIVAGEATFLDLKREFRAVEQQVKADYKIEGRMPSAWRSAKSTCLSAARGGIPIINADGKVQPKTDVGKLLKASKDGTLVRSDFDMFAAHIQSAYDIYTKLHGMDVKNAHVLLQSHALGAICQRLAA